MLWWFSKKRGLELEEKTSKSFSAVKHDINSISKWVKHLDNKDKQLFDIVSLIREDLTSIREEVLSLREGLDIVGSARENRRLFKKLPVFDKQTSVEDVQSAVQMAVQTGSFYDNFKGLSSNERLLVFTLMNNDMKLSYEDLALLLGKERSTIRGQINSVKQKCEGLIQEMSEKNGKKRVFIDEETKKKMQKYAKVRSREKS